MLKTVLIIVAVLLLVGIAFFFMIVKGPDVTKYEYLQKPQITTIPDTNVLAVSFSTTADGLKEVFGFLFKNYLKIKGVPKMPWKMPSSAARYDNALDFDMEAEKREATFKNMIWEGVVAIPLPANITNLSESKHDKLTARITTWEYGETAEILHIGPYEKEAPTVKELKDYIDKQGYEITGLHEEVYLRGPGTPFCKPKNYYTIIRYPVKKK
ncbi:MAG TPA: hypothetical protein EYH38_12005 [Leucothrix sp.]|nr:hypothetical protein [Leucothrix sp.]